MVEAGTKRQTIRRTLRCAPGDALQLFQGLRTKECRKLIDPDPVCKDVQTVKILPSGVFVDEEAIDPDLHKQFAQADGFLDLRDMQDFFYLMYKKSELSGFIIKW